MSKFIINLIFFSLLITTNAYANIECNCNKHKPSIKEQEKIDKILIERLKLTNEQIEFMKENHPQHKKEMEKIINRMEKLHTEIRNIYLLCLPKFQSDLRTAPYKTELVILKQNADKLKQENRKKFESVLTQEQKIEFEKIKKEFQEKHTHKKPTN